MKVQTVGWLMLFSSAVGGAILAYRRGYERGMHLGVTWPELACQRLNKRGYDMRYMMKDKI